MCDMPGCDNPGKKTYKSRRHTIGVLRHSPQNPGSSLSTQSNSVCEECYNDIIAGRKMPRFTQRFPEMDNATRKLRRLQKEKGERSDGQRPPKTQNR